MAKISKIQLPSGNVYKTYDIYDATAIHINDITSFMELKGTKATYDDILNIESPNHGDVWLVSNTGEEYIYDDTTGWVMLGYDIKIEVDSELSATSTNPIQNQAVAVAIDEATTLDNDLTVQLGTGGTIGGYKTGETIAAGTDIQTILNKLFQKAVPATYTAPTISLVAVGTAAGSYEYGTDITAQVKATFTKNDAGLLSAIQILENGNGIYAGIDNPLTSRAKTIQLTSEMSYTAIARHGEGAIKNNNLGEESPDGHIEAGEITSSAVKFTPYRQGYFYGVLDTDSSTTLTSDIIRGGTPKNGAYKAGNLPLIKASSVANRKRIFVACPATNTGVTKVIMPSAVNADCTANFVKQTNTVMVEGANGSDAIAYNVWVYEPASISDDQTFTVTLG